MDKVPQDPPDDDMDDIYETNEAEARGRCHWEGLNLVLLLLTVMRMRRMRTAVLRRISDLWLVSGAKRRAVLQRRLQMDGRLLLRCGMNG